MPSLTEKLKKLSTAPSRLDGQFDDWTMQSDTPRFLAANAFAEEFILFANADHVFMQSVFVPATALDNPNMEELREWDLMHDRWGLEYCWDRPDVWLTPPYDSDRVEAYRLGEPIIFHRSFAGYEGEKSYHEISQKFCHLFDLHYVAHRQAWCRLDENGDVEPVVRIINLPKGKIGYEGVIITVLRRVLDAYLLAAKSKLICAFDFTRYEPRNFLGWGNTREQSEITTADFAYRLTVQPGVGSYLRGIQIVSPLETTEELYRRLRRMDEPQRYESFIAHDAKNNVIGEISCAPGATANYFTKSDLPFEVTPAFFRPEVLQKYKADPNKYTLKERSIHCRGAWSLQTYDINEAGQVHTYLVYLRNLPHSEQVYWKSFNEPPKAPISKRAFTTDIKGEFHLDYNALQSILHLARKLSDKNVPWWGLRSDDLLASVHYPATDAASEWADELLALDQLIIEGFNAKWLRRSATELKQDPQGDEGSLKLLERCLRGVGFDEEEAKHVLAPLRELHQLRSKVKGHAKGTEAEDLRQVALDQHGSYRRHFENLCERCDASLGRIAAGLANLSGAEPVD